MTKSFIKKIFSFKKSEEREKEQILPSYEDDVIKESENTKNKQSSTDKEKAEQRESQKTISAKCNEKTRSFEGVSKKVALSGRVIVTDAVYQKKIEEFSSISSVEQKKTPWFGRLKKGLALSSQRLSGSISDLFVKGKLSEDTLQELEDILIQADLGVETATRITDNLSSSRYERNLSPDDIHTIMTDEIKKVLEPVAIPLELDLNHKPHVILLVGVNGTGKTTTIGKIAAKLTAGGLKVTLAAGDTFRAAAIEQLHIWGERTDSPVISTKLGADAASLAFDAYEKAQKANSDVLIIDTAGRLQNKTELMDELAKIIRVLKKHTPQAPHTVLQTLDATTGQNALNQVDIFRDIAGVNGLVMTKLDGSARGGILVAIAEKYKLPVHFIGIGENVEDLQPFSASDFAETIAGRYA
ncbi:signal recognition particle-docking protein FtsY [Bartonella pachyuromydis]|uniref:Signal recognition particle receptor FtsY n=1 Tax=Bartonella pachyuromydis TaxID=931097 RepID=A0ABP8VEB6_9HYPH